VSILSWLEKDFPKGRPNKSVARKAVRHLKKKEKSQLFSDDLSQMRAAEGRWFESLVYENLLEMVDTSDKISFLVRKGADAPFPPIPVQIGQNGLFYSNRGDINLRGNGQDIAEVDLLFGDKDGRICFAEIVTSGSDLKEMEAEVHFKKSLLGYLFGQASVPFVLFASVDISRSSIMRRLVRETESAVIITQSCEILKRSLARAQVRGVPRKPVYNPKLVDLENLQPRRPFDFLKIHNERRDKIITAMFEGKTGAELDTAQNLPPITRKILFGALHPSGTRTLMKDRKFIHKDVTYTADNLHKYFSKVILAIDIPEYEPVIYMKSKTKREYLKVVKKANGNLKVESKRTPQMTGFYLWLENLQPTLGSRITRKYAEIFL